MANRSYLCVSPHSSSYPSFSDPDFEPQVHTIASDVYCVPLLWLAMFRPGDLVTKTFEVPDGKDVDMVVATAPVAPVERALAQLDAAVPVLERLFADRVAEHAELLAAGIRAGEGGYVTIELEEIAMLEGDPDGYYERLRLALASLDGPTDAAADRARLADLAQLRPGRFPSARLLLDEHDAPDDDFWNFCRLVGASHLRSVPWEDQTVATPS